VIVARTIVVVDDEPDLCEMFQDYFEEHGYAVRIARDGAVAWDLLCHMAARPCIVISDVVMPQMDGHALYAAMKAEPKLAVVPIVFMTSNPAAAPAGELIMKKPVRFDVLLATVRRCCD
jgi:CheY-like chemotaxis protein